MANRYRDLIYNPLVQLGVGGLLGGLSGQAPAQAFLQTGGQAMQLGRQLEQQEALKVLSEMPELTTMQRQLLKVAPSEVVRSILTPTGVEATAAQRNYQSFKKIMETGTEEEKDYAKQIFTSGGRNVKSKEDFLIGISSQLAKDVTKSPEEIQASLPQYAGIYDKIIGAVDSESAFQIEIKAPQGFNGTDQEWKILKDANPNLPNEEIIKNWNKYKKG